jgi:hypothetical protein
LVVLTSNYFVSSGRYENNKTTSNSKFRIMLKYVERIPIVFEEIFSKNVSIKIAEETGL